MPPVVLYVAEPRSPFGLECARQGTVARGPSLLIPSILERFERENVRMILVAPHEPNESSFSGMRPWIQGEGCNIPQWPAALSQANELIIEGPYYRGILLAAWMLTKPGA